MKKSDNDKIWDDKFGLMDNPKTDCGFKYEKTDCGWNYPDTIRSCSYLGHEQDCPTFSSKKVEDNVVPLRPETKVMVEGVGKDAEIVVNEKGGKQSKSPMAMHLVDPEFLIEFARNKAEELEYLDGGNSTVVDEEDIDKYNYYRAIEYIAHYMLLGLDMYLTMAMDKLNNEDIEQLINIAKVLQVGADRYKPNNWRLIPQEEHINHALIHLVAAIAGDTQDDHENHALCRLMMAKATEKSEGFEYGAYVE